jgi:hypothetical protein
MNSRRVIEPGSAVSTPESDDEGTSDMPRRKNNGPMAPGPERDDAIVALYKEGKSVREIREGVGLSYDSAIYLALSRAGITPTRGGGGRPPANGKVAAPEVELAPVDTVPVDTETAQIVADEQTSVEAGQWDAAAEEPEAVTTYILHVAIMRPVIEDVEVDVSSFDEAVRAAHTLPGLVSILGVIAKGSVKPAKGGDA